MQKKWLLFMPQMELKSLCIIISHVLLFVAGTVGIFKAMGVYLRGNWLADGPTGHFFRLLGFHGLPEQWHASTPRGSRLRRISTKEFSQTSFRQ